MAPLNVGLGDSYLPNRIRQDPALDPLRGDPRFEALVTRTFGGGSQLPAHEAPPGERPE